MGIFVWEGHIVGYIQKHMFPVNPHVIWVVVIGIVYPRLLSSLKVMASKLTESTGGVGGEKERETDRDRDRERQREIERETDRQRDRQRQREREREREGGREGGREGRRETLFKHGNSINTKLL